MKRLKRRRLHIHEILTWIDSYRAAAGKWPTTTSGRIVDSPLETWKNLDKSLREGLRGLPGGSSLAQLLAAERGVRNSRGLPPLTTELVLRWADEHHQRTGSWPMATSGSIPGTHKETWSAVNVALKNGYRGFPGGSSLAQFLAEHRGVRNRKKLPMLTEAAILEWADLHWQRTGVWPKGDSGPVLDAPGETWTAVDVALQQGNRGLPGGSSLAFLLAEHRGRKHFWDRPNLSTQEILTWAEAYHELKGKWPTPLSGPIPQAPGDTWDSVNKALKNGSRGLPGGLSLAELLAVERVVRNRVNLPLLSREGIVAWAKAHFERTGKWPKNHDGPIPEAPGETWAAVENALRGGGRGLQGCSSLAAILAQEQLKRNPQDLPPLSKRKIILWADAHFQRTGKWPNVNSGPVVDAPGERWDLIDVSLREGTRGFSGGSSLMRLLATKRGVRNPKNLPPLTEGQILAWAKLHFGRSGSWPTLRSGPLVDAAGESWAGLNSALQRGSRGLPGRTTLAQLLARTKNGQPELSGEKDAAEIDPAKESDSGANVAERTGLS